MTKRERSRRMVLISAWLAFTVSVTLFVAYAVQSYKPGTLEISAPFGLGRYQFDRATMSDREREIAWKLYIQLETRKAAIPIDEEYDIIVGVYDSWYELFKTTRDYLIELPANELEGNENAQEIVRLSLDVLNQGLRPHLTEWQGKYRRWYELQLADPANDNKTPQEIQRMYPEYEALMKDMKAANVELRKYADELKKFSHLTPPSTSTKIAGWLKNRVGHHDPQSP